MNAGYLESNRSNRIDVEEEQGPPNKSLQLSPKSGQLVRDGAAANRFEGSAIGDSAAQLNSMLGGIWFGGVSIICEAN